MQTIFARRFTPAEQRLALAHELAHHRRGDLFADLAALLVLALHWFNPIAHRAYRAFRVDQEQACDLCEDPAATELISNYKTHKAGTLQPYEARVILQK